jgi:hypothetical protein
LLAEQAHHGDSAPATIRWCREGSAWVQRPAEPGGSQCGIEIALLAAAHDDISSR